MAMKKRRFINLVSWLVHPEKSVGQWVGWLGARGVPAAEQNQTNLR
jgi:hypothetical protein